MSMSMSMSNPTNKIPFPSFLPSFLCDSHYKILPAQLGPTMAYDDVAEHGWIVP